LTLLACLLTPPVFGGDIKDNERHYLRDLKRFLNPPSYLAASLLLEYSPPDDTSTFTEIQRWQYKNGKVKVIGESTFPRCRPIVCIGPDPKPCAVYTSAADVNFYFDPEKADEGDCCFVPDCTPEEIENGKQCGELCKPGVCVPTEEGCVTSDCYECETYGGDEVYTLEDVRTEPVCFSVGRKEDDPPGPRNVGITCGYHTLPFFGAVEENRDLGQLDCMFFRQDDAKELTSVDDGLLSATLPCVYLQLVFCGCGPRDMFTFGLPAPKFPCRPGKGKETCPLTGLMDEPEVAQKPCNCPIICEDVPGRQDEVCDSFDAIAELLEDSLGKGADGFDLWEAFFVNPASLGSGEPDIYKFVINES